MDSVMTKSEHPADRTDSPQLTARLHRWVIDHDDSWLFFVPYIVLAVVLSAVISLFWLVLIVGVHFGLELLRQHAVKPGLGGVVSRSLWEIKLDVALVLFALALTLYLEVTFGVLGLGHAARFGAMTGSRLALLQRALRGILLSLDDAAQAARVFLRRKFGKAEPAAAEAPHQQEAARGWTGAWTVADKVALGFGAVCLALVLAAPVLTHYTVAGAVAALIAEFHPFPR